MLMFLVRASENFESRLMTKYQHAANFLQVLEEKEAPGPIVSWRSKPTSQQYLEKLLELLKGLALTFMYSHISKNISLENICVIKNLLIVIGVLTHAQFSTPMKVWNGIFSIGIRFQVLKHIFIVFSSSIQIVFRYKFFQVVFYKNKKSNLKTRNVFICFRLVGEDVFRSFLKNI